MEQESGAEYLSYLCTVLSALVDHGGHSGCPAPAICLLSRAGFMEEASQAKVSGLAEGVGRVEEKKAGKTR